MHQFVLKFLTFRAWLKSHAVCDIELLQSEWLEFNAPVWLNERKAIDASLPNKYPLTIINDKSSLQRHGEWQVLPDEFYDALAEHFWRKLRFTYNNSPATTPSSTDAAAAAAVAGSFEAQAREIFEKLLHSELWDILGDDNSIVNNVEINYAVDDNVAMGDDWCACSLPHDMNMSASLDNATIDMTPTSLLHLLQQVTAATPRNPQTVRYRIYSSNLLVENLWKLSEDSHFIEMPQHQQLKQSPAAVKRPRLQDNNNNNDNYRIFLMLTHPGVDPNATYCTVQSAVRRIREARLHWNPMCHRTKRPPSKFLRVNVLVVRRRDDKNVDKKKAAAELATVVKTQLPKLSSILTVLNREIDLMLQSTTAIGNGTIYTKRQQSRTAAGSGKKIVKFKFFLSNVYSEYTSSDELQRGPDNLTGDVVRLLDNCLIRARRDLPSSSPAVISVKYKSEGMVAATPTTPSPRESQRISVYNSNSTDAHRLQLMCSGAAGTSNDSLFIEVRRYVPYRLPSPMNLFVESSLGSIPPTIVAASDIWRSCNICRERSSALTMMVPVERLPCLYSLDKAERLSFETHISTPLKTTTTNKDNDSSDYKFVDSRQLYNLNRGSIERMLLIPWYMFFPRVKCSKIASKVAYVLDDHCLIVSDCNAVKFTAAFAASATPSPSRIERVQLYKQQQQQQLPKQQQVNCDLDKLRREAVDKIQKVYEKLRQFIISDTQQQQQQQLRTKLMATYKTGGGLVGVEGVGILGAVMTRVNEDFFKLTLRLDYARVLEHGNGQTPYSIATAGAINCDFNFYVPIPLVMTLMLTKTTNSDACRAAILTSALNVKDVPLRVAVIATNLRRLI